MGIIRIKMASTENTKLPFFCGEKLEVEVQLCLPDVIVVSCEHDGKIFQGVLLDSSKGQIPCGVYPPDGQLFPPPPPPLATEELDDCFASVSSRHTYFQPQPVLAPEAADQQLGVTLRRCISLTPKFKAARLTVRLRPRQVLCAGCRAVCDERGQLGLGPNGSGRRDRGHVTLVRKERRSSVSSNEDHPHSAVQGGSSRPTSPHLKKRVMLVPRLVKLKESEIQAAIYHQNSKTVSNQSEDDSPESFDSMDNDMANDASMVSEVKIASDIPRRVTRGKRKKYNFKPRGRQSCHSTRFYDESVDVISPIPSVNIKSVTGKATYESAFRKESQQAVCNVQNLEVLDTKFRRSGNRKLHSSATDFDQMERSPVKSVDVNTTSSLSLGVRKSQRNRCSFGAMEDLWDESAFDEFPKLPEKVERVCNNQTGAAIKSEAPKTGPVLKISFGAGGHSTTVLNIMPKNGPAKRGKISNTKDMTSKAARKALKRAKKEVQKKCSGYCSPKFGSLSSPVRLVGGSPARRHHVGSMPLKPCVYILPSPVIADLNQAVISNTSTSTLNTKRKKRKHKKRGYVDQSHHDDSINNITPGLPGESNIMDSVIVGDTQRSSQNEFGPIKIASSSQNLSISIKRVNDFNYMTYKKRLCNERALPCPDVDTDTTFSLNHTASYVRTTLTSPSNSSPTLTDGFKSEADSESPPHLASSKWTWETACECIKNDGASIAVGDVMWGKVHGFPWWPAKVASLRVLRDSEGKTQWQQAHVNWYGSSTSSLMEVKTLQPFLQMFKARHNKRKRGPYREAVKKAMEDTKLMEKTNDDSTATCSGDPPSDISDSFDISTVDSLSLPSSMSPMCVDAIDSCSLPTETVDSPNRIDHSPTAFEVSPTLFKNSQNTCKFAQDAVEHSLNCDEDLQIAIEESQAIVENSPISIADSSISSEDSLSRFECSVENLVPLVDKSLTVTEDSLSSVEDSLMPVEDSLTPVEDALAPVQDSPSPVQDLLTPVQDSLMPVEDSLTPDEDSLPTVENSPRQFGPSLSPVEHSLPPIENSPQLEDSLSPTEVSVDENLHIPVASSCNV